MLTEWVKTEKKKKKTEKQRPRLRHRHRLGLTRKKEQIEETICSLLNMIRKVFSSSFPFLSFPSVSLLHLYLHWHYACIAKRD